MKKLILGSALGCLLGLAVTAPALAAADMKPKNEPSAAQLAVRERMTKCSVEWKDAKAGGKLEAGTKWPKFWSQCNTRLKGAKA